MYIIKILNIKYNQVFEEEYYNYEDFRKRLNKLKYSNILKIISYTNNIEGE